MKQLTKNKTKHHLNPMIEYWTTALVFCTAVIFLEIFPIYIILSVSLFAYLASLVFSQKF